MPEFLALELEVDLILQSFMSAASLFPRPGCGQHTGRHPGGGGCSVKYSHIVVQHHHRPSQELFSVWKLKLYELNTNFPLPSPRLAPGTRYSTFCPVMLMLSNV